MLDAIAAIIKAVGYAAAFVAVGPLIARATLSRGLSTLPSMLTGMTRGAGTALMLAACAAALLFFLRLGGDVGAVPVGVIFLSPLGIALALQMLGGLGVAMFAKRPIALAGALAILLAFGIVGHSASRGIQTSMSVVLHVTAAAWWFGGLCILLNAGRTGPSDLFTALVARFSRQAVRVVGVLLVAALTTSVLLLEFRINLELAYQRGLLAKLLLTLGLLLLAGMNRLVLMPRLAFGPGAHVWLRRAILVELLLFAGVMGVTAYVTTYLSPHAAGGVAHGHDGQVQGNGLINVADPWASVTPGAVATSAAYMVIVNNQPVEDRLVAASSPWAEQVTLHVSIRDVDNIVRMRKMAALPVPAGGQVALTSGAHHLMFTGLYAPFVAGDAVPLTLTFEHAGEVEVTLTVRPLGGTRVPGHDH